MNKLQAYIKEYEEILNRSYNPNWTEFAYELSEKDRKRLIELQKLISEI